MIYAYMRLCVYTHDARMRVCVYVCMHACMHVCMHICVYVFMYVCMHVCVCVCVWARAHVHVFPYRCV